MKFIIHLTIWTLFFNVCFGIQSFRYKNLNKFDDSQMIEKSQLIWEKLSKPSLEAGYDTTINNLVTELHALVQQKANKLTGEDRAILIKEWDQFNDAFATAANSVNKIGD